MNSSPIICDAITDGLGDLYTCAPVGDYTRIRTPFLYPDGDVIDIFVRQQNGRTVFTDLGETLRWLRMHSISDKRSPKQNRFLDDLRLDYGVELFKGVLRLESKSSSDFAKDLARISQAALRASDLWLTFRTRFPNSSNEDVAELLETKRVPFERDKKIAGRSGRVWTLDFASFTQRRTSLIHVLSTGSRTVAHGYAEHVFASFYDLSQMTTSVRPTRFVSLFDDTLDVWQPEDVKLVAEISDVAYFSKPDAFYDLIAA